MACNIDGKGKAVRLICGVVTLVAAAVLAVLAAAGWMPMALGYGLAVAAGLGGAFQVYEGWAGWCVVRAMGFKTPI
jgi:hypothetical protein